MGAMTDPDRTLLCDLLRAAGRVALADFRTATSVLKPDGSALSEADLRSEAVLVEGLARAFPRASIVSEEGVRITGSDGTWYVDPIDGTSAYLDGLAHWGPTLCFVRDGRPEIGALHFPRLGEFWFARRGGGAWRDEVRLPHLSARRQPPRHQLVLYVPSRFHRFCPVPWPGKIRALGSTAAHLALLASGSGEAAVVPSWQPWDVAAGLLMLNEVGLTVMDSRGSPMKPLSGSLGLPFLAGAPTALSLLSQDGWAERVLR